MVDANSIIVRPYRAGDGGDFAKLMQTGFGAAFTPEHWRWKLAQPSNAVENVWLALIDGRSIFQYAGIPIRFSLNQAPATMMVSVDAMTDPRHRRRGLLTRVAAEAYRAWRRDGVAFTIGLPNQQWGTRADALGWQTLFPLQWLVRPLSPEATLARKLKIPILRRATLPAVLWNRVLQVSLRTNTSVHLERVLHAGDAFDHLWNSVKSSWAFSTVRDRDWVNWRFLASATRTYEVRLAWRRGTPTGYAAHSLIRSNDRLSAYLADLLVARTDLETRDALLGDLIHSLRSVQAEAVFTLAVPGTANYQWLRSCGFFPRQHFSVKVVPFDTELPLTLMRNPVHWNLSGADFDVV